MQAHHRRSLWPGAPPTTMLPGFVPDETTTIGEAPLTKPRVWFDARANKARITYPPGGGPAKTPTAAGVVRRAVPSETSRWSPTCAPGGTTKWRAACGAVVDR